MIKRVMQLYTDTTCSLLCLILIRQEDGASPLLLGGISMYVTPCTWAGVHTRVCERKCVDVREKQRERGGEEEGEGGRVTCLVSE
jgi:hypothetical protein